MATQRHRASGSGPSVPALLAWTGFDRAASSDPAREAAFSAAALTGGGMRSGRTRHARHGAAPTGSGRTALLGPARARHVTAGLVLVCGSVLAATVTATDGTIGPPDGPALPEFAPGRPAPVAPPSGGAPVAKAAVSTPLSSPMSSALAAGSAAGAATTTARPSPHAAAGPDGAQAAPSAGAAAGSSDPSGAGDGAASSRPSGSTPAQQPEPSGSDAAPRPGGGSDEDRPSPVERVTEPVEQVTEPVRRTTEQVQEVAEPVTSRVVEPVDEATAAVEDAGQPAMSMLDQPLS